MPQSQGARQENIRRMLRDLVPLRFGALAYSTEMSLRFSDLILAPPVEAGLRRGLLDFVFFRMRCQEISCMGLCFFGDVDSRLGGASPNAFLLMGQNRGCLSHVLAEEKNQ